MRVPGADELFRRTGVPEQRAARVTALYGNWMIRAQDEVSRPPNGESMLSPGASRH